MNPIRISLTEDDFKCLVSGGIVKKPLMGDDGITVQIALKDIGYDRMVAAIRSAIERH